MIEFILFLVIAVSIGGYQDQQYKEDFGKARVTIMDLACDQTDIDIRINPPMEEGETTFIEGSDGVLKSCTLRGGQLFCTDVWT